MTEEWKPIPGYEGLYEASSEGRIRSVDRTVHTYSARGKRDTALTRKGKVLSLNIGPHGYLLACLSKEGKAKTKRVNRLVCSAFHGARPETDQACHNDGDKLNNASANLRWDTPTANQADRRLHGTHLQGELVSTSTLTREQVTGIRASRTFSEVVGVIPVSKTQYYRIKKGEAWAHL